jgi:hypothetical protein
MKNLLCLLTFSCFLSLGLSAQQSLEYNQSLIVSGAQQTVPAGKVWKVTAIYGEEARFEECVNITQSSTHELNRIRCGYAINSATQFYLKVPFYTITKMQVNGVDIVSSVNGFNDSPITFPRYTNDPTCSGSSFNTSRDYGCTNKPTDPNLLPVWLPAGTTLASGGSNTFVSVIEFNVIP